MKILYCEVENYGKIKQRKIVFDGGLQEFCEENGYGKSTLCSFLRVMFYGMETRREKDVTFGDREHFYPFSGGKFGGSVTFLYGGKNCRIERFFDEKSATKDTFCYFEEDEPVRRDGNAVGKEIFGVDEEAFCRSLFFDSRATEIAATDGMREKLGAIAEGTADGRNVAEATALLEKKRKEIVADRKNANCETFRYDMQRKTLAAEADALRAQSEAIESLYARHGELQKEIAKEEREEEKLRERETIIAKTETYFEWLKQAEEQRKKSAEIAARYPAGVFAEEEIARLNTAVTEAARLSGRLSACVFPPDKEGTLEKFNAAFRSGVPAQEEIGRIEEEIGTLQRLEAALAAEIPFSEREEELFERFDGKREAQEDITRAVALRETCRAADQEIVALSSGIVAPPPAPNGGNNGEKSKKGRGMAAIFAVFGVLLLIAGGVWCITNVAAGAAVCAAGALSVAAAIAAMRSKGKGGAEKSADASSAAYSSVNGKIALYREEKGRAEEEIRALLYRYGYSAEDIYAAMERASNDFTDYNRAKKRLTAAQNERREKEEEKRRTERALTEFFTPYRLTEGTFSERLRRLKNGIEKFEELSAEKKKTEESAALLRRRAEEIRRDATEIFAARGFSAPAEAELGKAIEKLSADASEYLRCVSAEKTFKEKALKVRAENGLSDEALKNAVDGGGNGGAEQVKAQAEELRAKLSGHRKELAAAERAIAEAEEAAEKLTQKQRELDELRDKTKDAEERAKLFRTAAEVLKQADNAVMQRYVAPVRERFVAYADAIERTLGVDVTMNRDFSLSFSRNGARRKDGHLSAGERYVCALCLRLSLIDEMFAGREQPFLILDDPFVHLDEAHFSKTAALIRELSEKRQLIYFTCHASRSVNNAAELRGGK